MSLPRFFLPPDQWQPGALTLEGDEAAHCARVLRRAPGDDIEIFDGAGRVALATITSAARSRVTAAIQRLLPRPAPPPAIHLLPALIKNEPFEWLLEKAVELGAASVQPLITARTVVHPAGPLLEKKLARWRRHMVESAKQCHTPFITRLEAPLPFTQAIASLPPGGLKIMPSLSDGARTLRGISSGESAAHVITGPEGDFTPDEEALAQSHGFTPVTLGPLILRAETAALTTLAILAHEMR